MSELILKGVRQNNLKNVSVSIPLGKTTIVTGPSGSGKSSLAFETIYAEGQRRYMQSLSTYARQFLEKFRAPDVDKIENIPPTIALEQINPVRNSRATVGTTTEIYDYLRLLFEKIGREFCAKCNIAMERKTLPELFELIAKGYADKTALLTYQRALPKNTGDRSAILEELLRNGYSRIVVGTEIVNLNEEGVRVPSGEMYVIVDRIRMPPVSQSESIQTRLTEGIRNALKLGNEKAFLLVDTDGKYLAKETLTTQSHCPKCGLLSPPKASISFSFNSPLGACETCKGFGNTLELDEELVVPNPTLSIDQGAIDPFTKPSLKHWQKKLKAFCETQRIDSTLAYRDLSREHRKLVFEGSKKFVGVKGVFSELEKDKYKMQIRVFISRYTSPFTCKSCNGKRLNANSLRVKVVGLSISEISELTLEEMQNTLSEGVFTPREHEVARDILAQLARRLDYICTVGLGYLTLARLSRSLSGGEYQRILLATQLSQGLTDTMYVLDEPSIGLHPKDTQQLLKVLSRLRELGNSLVLVEHDPEVIEWGEHILDLGPGSGSRGGQLVFSGSRELFNVSDCLTSVAVRNWREECKKSLAKPIPDSHEQWLELSGARGNNLKRVNLRIPLKHIVGITGVSGSGKSTLIVDTLYQALSKVFHGRSEKISPFESISGIDYLGGVELVDQSPIGKSSRSNPITFMKAYDEIRTLFANTPESAKHGFTAGHFSFNVPGGRCDECEGEGRVRVDMVFMEDVYIPCQVCDEKRFKPSVLRVKFRGKNIDDVLHLTVDGAFEFFQGIPALRAKLAILQDVGLGYIQLGQPGFTLSGGEAQRLKIARELAGTGSRKLPTLFILDEPTTGLHFNEISRLILVLRRLISAGHSVVVIEHNLQMICSAHHLIDLGPDGGDRGGYVVAEGHPKAVAEKRLPYTSQHLADLLLTP